MFSTLEYFSNTPCPFYGAGLCDRAHCPFRHSSADVDDVDFYEKDDDPERLYEKPAKLKQEKSKKNSNSSKKPVKPSSCNNETVAKVTEEPGSNMIEEGPELELSGEEKRKMEEEEKAEWKRLEEEYERTLLGAEEEWDDDEIAVDSDIAEQFLMPEDADSEDSAELVDACYKEWLRSKSSNVTSCKEVPVKKPKPSDATFNSQETATTSLACVSPRKRIAHTNAESSVTAQAPLIPAKSRPTPAETLRNRYNEIQRQTQKVPGTERTSSESCGNGTRRISHSSQIGLVSMPFRERIEVKPLEKGYKLPQDSYSTQSCTAAQSQEKGLKRKAHSPVKAPVTQHRAPVIARGTLGSSKIPLNSRQQTLEQLFKACQNIYEDHDKASERALEEELALAVKHKSKQVYIGSAANCLKRLRDEVSKVPSAKKNFFGDAELRKAGSTSSQLQSHEKNLIGPTKHSWSIEAKKSLEPLVKNDLYKALKSYILTAEQLADNGYPMMHPSGDRGRVITKNKLSKPTTNVDSTNRVCDRCNKKFKIGLSGLPVVKEVCIYHSGRNFKRRGFGGVIEGRFTCCDGDALSGGCAVANTHVSVHPADEMYGFVTALKDEGDEDIMGNDPWDVVAIDCEMVYTTYGSELARATFISAEKKILYDELVKPIHPIVDYNTRYSGITEDMMEGVHLTLTDVQAVMLTRFRPNTILIGHSLESDLIALKLKHDCVIDTSVLMPHRMGPPYKRALRNLASECLGKIIQTGEEGHDSAEDAMSALEIVLWKLQGDRMLLQSSSQKRLKI